MENFIENVDAKYVFMSYNDEGIISKEEVKEIFSKRGEYKLFQKEYRRYKADTDENRTHAKASVIEYLHCVKIK